MITISFTGHRYARLGILYWSMPKNLKLMLEISKTIKGIIAEHPNEAIHIITGGAVGVDTIAFHVAYKLKRQYSNIILEIAVPFRNQPKVWHEEEDIERYYEQLGQADIITYVDSLEAYKRSEIAIGEYHSDKLQARNEYMMDKADIIIAVFDGKRTGGTFNAIQYVKEFNKQILRIDPRKIA